MTGSDLVLRRATPADSAACHQLLWQSATDLGARHGTPLEGTADDWWESLQEIHAFLAREAAEWWVAERRGQVIGYARSVERGGLFELTELFVQPGEQSRGLGKALIERAFPDGRGEVRLVIATTDVRALTRYQAAGTVARFPMYTLAGEPHAAQPASLVPQPIGAVAGGLDAVSEIERAVTGFPRSRDELAWLSGQREGFVYRQGDSVVGYAFISQDGAGPIAAVEPDLQPDILLHIEDRASELGIEKLELETPGINAVAIAHLGKRGFRIDPWLNLVMSNEPFGVLDRYIGFSPPIFL
jgi:N-acetylglutamate synthase-like GNAT family acetyltransferase